MKFVGGVPAFQTKYLKGAKCDNFSPRQSKMNDVTVKKLWRFDIVLQR